MIESKFKTSGILSIIFSLFICLVLVGMICILATHVIPGKGIPTKRGTTPSQGVVFLAIFGFLLFVFIYTLIRYCVIIQIDQDARTISFRNIITFQEKTYDFNAFDCFLDTFANSKSGQYKNIYLIKDRKAAKIICGLYFENIDELQAALSPIKYLGFQENSSGIARKALFNKPIID
jgi:hypothetical protein